MNSYDQVKCYETEVPTVLAEFERLERQRVDGVRVAFQAYVELETKLPPLVEESLQRMNAVVTAVDAEADIRFVSFLRSVC